VLKSSTADTKTMPLRSMLVRCRCTASTAERVVPKLSPRRYLGEFHRSNWLRNRLMN